MSKSMPTSRDDFHALAREDQIRIYKFARAHAVARETGLTGFVWDKDMFYRAEQLVDIGWSMGASLASVALGDYLTAHDTNHTHTSPETEAWSSMEGTTFTTTENHAEAYAAIFAA